MSKGCLEGDTVPLVPGMLANSIEECCDEGSISSYLLEMICS